MTLRKLGAMVLAAVLAAGLLPAGALAARNEKMDADQMDIPRHYRGKGRRRDGQCVPLVDRRRRKGCH